MITIKNDTPGLVAAAALGEFTLADFRELESAIEHALRFQGRTRLLLDLRDMAGFTIDVAWGEIRLLRGHPQGFERIAVVTDDQWLQWSAWLAQTFTDAAVQAFEDYETALAWAAGD